MATEALGRTVDTRSDNGAFFRTVARIDGVATLVFGAASAAASAWLPSIMGAGTTAFYVGLGIAAGLLGAWLLRLSTTPVSRRTMLAVQALALVVLIDCIALLVGGWVTLSAVGFWTVFAITDVVALLAVAYYVGMRRAE